MKHEVIRRQQLGLAMHGPYSRNRRRHESTYIVLVVGVLISAASFIAALFAA
jgi:hypothetical protein